MATIRSIIVCRAPGSDKARGLLRFRGRIHPCILGKNGITSRKREGDKKTPSGSFPMIKGFVRHDRSRIRTSIIPLKPISKDIGWCDEPSNANYNRLVRLPFKASHEVLLREDSLYDIIVVMDHNMLARNRNRGSAVFFHLTDNKPYTAGCVAIAPSLMDQLLPLLSSGTKMTILP